MGLDTDSAVLLIVQSDAGGDQSVTEINLIGSICESYGGSVAIATEPWEIDAYLTARKLALPSLGRKGTTLLDDVAVPCARIADLLTKVQEIAKAHDVLIGTFGHVGDGNMHPTIVFDRNDSSSVRRAMDAFGQIIKTAISLGGTITGEHGVGLLKRDYLEMEIGNEAMTLSRSIKELLDPAGIMNPRKVLI